ncbi:MAG: metallopeptidase family protein [Nocardioides sp.]|uniref:metallopeptidase family protein n=1 Tax=Nocardioides sp. TaxID=35761 RepID=UPI0039E42D64
MARLRDRHGRGMRGPGVVPKVPGEPVLRTRRERFDDLALGIVTEIDGRWQERLGLIEYAVEETPVVLDGMRSQDPDGEPVPLSALTRGTGTTPTRLVLFRQPIEHRCESRSELELLVLSVVVERIAELLGIEAEQVDPRYDGED